MVMVAVERAERASRVSVVPMQDNVRTCLDASQTVPEKAAGRMVVAAHVAAVRPGITAQAMANA